jgi:hypothetical protein
MAKMGKTECSIETETSCLQQHSDSLLWGFPMPLALTLLKHNFITDYCKEAKQTYHILQELLELTLFCPQACLTPHKQVLQHTLKF